MFWSHFPTQIHMLSLTDSRTPTFFWIEPFFWIPGKEIQQMGRYHRKPINDLSWSYTEPHLLLTASLDKVWYSFWERRIVMPICFFSESLSILIDSIWLDIDICICIESQFVGFSGGESRKSESNTIMHIWHYQGESFSTWLILSLWPYNFSSGIVSTRFSSLQLMRMAKCRFGIHAIPLSRRLPSLLTCLLWAILIGGRASPLLPPCPHVRFCWFSLPIHLLAEVIAGNRSWWRAVWLSLLCEYLTWMSVEPARYVFWEWNFLQTLAHNRNRPL